VKAYGRVVGGKHEPVATNNPDAPFVLEVEITEVIRRGLIPTLPHDALVIMTQDEPVDDARVVARARAMYLERKPATEFRAAYVRCSVCSWTWDADGTEKHGGSCIFAPVGLADGHTYKPVEGEPPEFTKPGGLLEALSRPIAFTREQIEEARAAHSATCAARKDPAIFDMTCPACEREAEAQSAQAKAEAERLRPRLP
jgi:hypothetical protein